MTRDSNRIIGDIIEINSDIIEKRVKSKSPKIITNIKEKYYRYRLNKVIKGFKSKLIFNKSTLEELLSYINAYYEGKYKCIVKVDIKNLSDDNITTSEIIVNPKDDNLNNVRYYITINKKPEIDLSVSQYYIDGTVIYDKINIENLSNKQNNKDYIYLKYLNDALVDVLTEFINEYLSRFKVKGYTKEVIK